MKLHTSDLLFVTLLVGSHFALRAMMLSRKELFWALAIPCVVALMVGVYVAFKSAAPMSYVVLSTVVGGLISLGSILAENYFGSPEFSAIRPSKIEAEYAKDLEINFVVFSIGVLVFCFFGFTICVFRRLF